MRQTRTQVVRQARRHGGSEDPTVTLPTVPASDTRRAAAVLAKITQEVGR